jgi:hypothetical protein
VSYSALGKLKIMNYNMNNYLGAKKGSYPFRYLGIPMHYRKLYNSNQKTIEERIEKTEQLEKQILIGGGGGQIGAN